MQSNNRIFDDMARVTSGALGTLAGVRREVEAMVRHQIERLLDGMDLVTRDEFETVRAMAEKARAEQEKLEARVATLEEALGEKATKAKRQASTAADKAAPKEKKPKSKPAPDQP